jgi:hypothetical protein
MGSALMSIGEAKRPEGMNTSQLHGRKDLKNNNFQINAQLTHGYYRNRALTAHGYLCIINNKGRKDGAGDPQTSHRRSTGVQAP